MTRVQRAKLLVFVVPTLQKAKGGAARFVSVILPAKGWASPQPVVQAQNGTFFGAVGIGPSPGTVTQDNLVAFDQSGNVLWSVPNDYPQIATADGGVIGYSGVTYDNNGRATGMIGNIPTQSWTGNAYTDGPVRKVVFTPTNNATGTWTVDGANASANSTAAFEETLYFRSFAPWYKFGPDPYVHIAGILTPCFADCFYGDNRNFSTTVGKGVTARINAVVRILLPAMVPITVDAFSNESKAVFRLFPFQKAVQHPTLTKTFLGDGHLNFHLAGSNPLVIPSPDIDTHLDITGVPTAGQVCFSGRLYGDAFPNSEAFVINSRGQATSLVTFATTYGRNIGPDIALFGDDEHDMGSFSNICMPK